MFRMELERRGRRARFLLYLDDIVVVLKEGQLVEIVAVLEQALEGIGLRLVRAKSSFMPCSAGTMPCGESLGLGIEVVQGQIAVLGS